MPDVVEVYRDNTGAWRWKRLAGNNEIISSGESHESRSNAVRSARRANTDQVEFQVESEGES